MTRICSIFAASVAILQPKVVTSFAVRPHSRIFRVRLSSTVEGAKNLDVLDIDSVHAFARECSDNLECSIEDLDQVKNGKKQREREIIMCLVSTSAMITWT